MKVYVNKFRGILVFSAAAYALCALLETVFAVILGYVVDDAISGNMKQLIWHTVANIGIILVSLLLYWGAIHLRRTYVMKSVSSIKNGIMSSVYNRGLLAYHENSNSYYINLLSNDIDVVETDYLLPRPVLLFYIAQFVFSFFALLYISWKATLCFILLFLIPLIIPQLFAPVLAKRSRRVSSENESFTFELKEQIQGMAEIVENRSVHSFMKRFVDANERQQRSKKKVGTAQTFVNELSSACGTISQLGCMAVGGALVIGGEMSVGALIAAIQLLNSVFSPINGIAQISAQKQNAKPIMEKLTAELQMIPAPSSSGSVLSGDIVYNQLCAWYEEEKLVIRDFSCHFDEGKTYAVIGDSGRGKTTIFKCLLKLHSKFSGDIHIGGQDVRALSAEDIYGLIGYVPQNAYLFNDTIENNITMYGDYSQQEVAEVMGKVNLSDLAEGNRGTLGDSGAEISGGEKQRIILARALIRKPRVLLFDEPTTALDPDTRDSINELFFSLDGYTRIIITHDRRPEYLERFDEVISL